MIRFFNSQECKSAAKSTGDTPSSVGLLFLSCVSGCPALSLLLIITCHKSASSCDCLELMQSVLS